MRWFMTIPFLVVAASDVPRVVTETGSRTTTIEPIDVMTFDEDARITGMRAFWSPEDARGD